MPRLPTSNYIAMKLKELNSEDRPRERLVSKGAEALSNAELLAILLRTGFGAKNVIELSYELLSKAGDLVGLSMMSIDSMMSIPGIGQDKATTIAAAFELGRRFSAESGKGIRTSITSSRQIYDIMIPTMKGLDHEECWIIFLNRANIIISKERLSTGGLSATVIDTNIIIRKALEKKAAGLILVHNHPSGNPHPGTADIRETEKLKKAADTFTLSLLDHIIVCNDSFYSFADETVSTA